LVPELAPKQEQQEVSPAGQTIARQGTGAVPAGWPLIERSSTHPKRSITCTLWPPRRSTALADAAGRT